MAFFGSDWIEKPQPEIVEIYVEHPERKYTGKDILNILEDLEVDVISNEDDWSRRPQTMAQVFITKIKNNYK